MNLATTSQNRIKNHTLHKKHAKRSPHTHTGSYANASNAQGKPVAAKQRKTKSKTDIGRNSQRKDGTTQIKSRQAQPQKKRQTSRHAARQRRSSPSATETQAPSTSSQTTTTSEFTLQHFLVYFGYVVSIPTMLVSALDLIIAIPFLRASITFDVTFLISATLLFLLSWNAHRDLS